MWLGLEMERRAGEDLIDGECVVEVWVEAATMVRREMVLSGDRNSCVVCMYHF